MTNTWLLVFLARGVIVSAGDVMPLDQCIERMHWTESAACINTQDPVCRINKDATVQPDLADRCIKRLEKSQ